MGDDVDRADTLLAVDTRVGEFLIRGFLGEGAMGQVYLKVWDVETYACLFTHHGDAAYTAVAATPTAIVAGDDVGAVWVLEWPP